LNHSLPWKILPDCIRFSFLWISQQHFFVTLSPLRLTPNLEDLVPVFMPPPWQDGPVITPPRHRVLFSSPITRRATVEIF
jgi:hypothetical protein